MSYINAFDSSNYPSAVPAALVSGDRWAWKLGNISSAYPSTSYSVKWVARLESGADNASEISVTGSPSGADYLFEVASSSTAGYGRGRYAWQLIVTRTSDSERVVIDADSVEVVADRDTQTGDLRSHARRMLERVEAMLEGTADLSVQSYSIAGRSLSRYSPAELQDLRDTYRREVRAEALAALRANGCGGAGQIRVRL